MKVIFMGRKKYAANVLQWLYDNKFDIKYVCTDSQYYNSATALKAKELSIDVISQEKAEMYVDKNPNDIDLVISYLWWKKIKGSLITKPKFGCINFHPALLPEWRGTAGYNIAILNKLTEWGATAHYVDDSIDTGEIIRIFKFSFDYRCETAYSLEKKTQEIQMELFKSVLTDILKYGKLDSIKQNDKRSTYISKNEMLEMMHVDINNITNEDLDLKIRAFWFPPYNGAGFEKNGKFYTLINDDILKTLKDDNTTYLI